MKTQYDFRKEFKNSDDNAQKLILFSSGAFFRTFDSDAEFLSALFGFAIVRTGGYEMVGFPKTVAEKYFALLRFQGFSFQLLKSIEGEWMLLDEHDADKPLEYDPTQLHFLEPKEKPKEYSKEPVGEKDFKHFLRALAELIQKYL
jgi:hypothetical protein